MRSADGTNKAEDDEQSDCSVDGGLEEEGSLAVDILVVKRSRDRLRC